MPASIVCCVALHHRGTELLSDDQLRASSAAAVAISALIPDALRQINNGMEELVKLHNTWDGFDLKDIAQQVHEEFEELCPDAHFSFSLLNATKKAFERVEALN